MLNTYEDFISLVESLGFLPLSPLVPGLPSLGGETVESNWHTGLETDPWRWKDRAAEEKRLAYGCILGGHKGFVSQRMYPIFYAAFHPSLSMPERWENGLVTQKTWQVWQLFEQKGKINISQLRESFEKQARGAVDAAVQQLQHEYYITVDGNERKVSAKGEFYGWPVIRYCRVADWAPEGWLDSGWSVEEARKLILDDGQANGADRRALAKKLGWGKG